MGDRCWWIDRRSFCNLDWTANGCCDVNSHSEGDSIHGCRQMIGNVWEMDFQ